MTTYTIEVPDEKVNNIETSLGSLADKVFVLEERIKVLEENKPPPEPPPEPPVITYPEEFKKKAIQWGVKHGEALIDSPPSAQLIGEIQYDADWVFWQIYQMTSDDRFLKYSNHAYESYKLYVVKGPQPYYVYTDGLYRRAKEGDQSAIDIIVQLLGVKGPYIPLATPLEWTAGEHRSRPVAYALRTLRHAELLGAPRHPKHEALLEQSLDHIQQWINKGTQGNFAPFMFALTGLELLRQVELFPERKVEIENRVNWGMSHTNEVAWRPDNAWCHRIDDHNAHLGSPTLNQLIVPVLARVNTLMGAAQTQTELAFDKGISSGYYSGSKQFNQLHCNVFDYLRRK